MNSFLPPQNDDVEASPMMVGPLAVLFSVAILALVYLSQYSIGTEFSDKTPQFHQGAIVATNQ